MLSRPAHLIISKKEYSWFNTLLTLSLLLNYFKSTELPVSGLKTNINVGCALAPQE